MPDLPPQKKVLKFSGWLCWYWGMALLVLGHGQLQVVSHLLARARDNAACCSTKCAGHLRGFSSCSLQAHHHPRQQSDHD